MDGHVRAPIIHTLLCLALSLHGCASNPAYIDPKKIGMSHEMDYGISIKDKIRFSVSDNCQSQFEGRPDTFAGSAISVKIDLKDIQEVAAKTVLGSVVLRLKFGQA